MFLPLPRGPHLLWHAGKWCREPSPQSGGEAWLPASCPRCTGPCPPGQLPPHAALRLVWTLPITSPLLLRPPLPPRVLRDFGWAAPGSRARRCVSLVSSVSLPAPQGLPILTPLPPVMGQSFLLGLMIPSFPQGPPGVPGPPGPPGMPGLQVRGEKRRRGLGAGRQGACSVLDLKCAAPPPRPCTCHFSVFALLLPRVVRRAHWCVLPASFGGMPIACSPGSAVTPGPSSDLRQLSGTQTLSQLTIRDATTELTVLSCILKLHSPSIHATSTFFAHLLFSRHCFRCWRNSSRQKDLYPLGACFLAGDTDDKQEKYIKYSMLESATC